MLDSLESWVIVSSWCGCWEPSARAVCALNYLPISLASPFVYFVFTSIKSLYIRLCYRYTLVFSYKYIIHLEYISQYPPNPPVPHPSLIHYSLLFFCKSTNTVVSCHMYMHAFMSMLNPGTTSEREHMIIVWSWLNHGNWYSPTPSISCKSTSFCSSFGWKKIPLCVYIAVS